MVIEDQQLQLLRKKIVDSNEPGEMRMALLQQGWEQQRLYSGDYSFFTSDYKKVGIERKEVGDFFTSLGDRLTRQLEQLLDSYDYRILMIEGSWARVSNTEQIINNHGIASYTWDLVWNYIRRWQDKGITLELTTSMGHTIRRLNAIYALYQKPYSMVSRSREFGDDRVLAFPSGCRGKTGMAILEQFGSLRAVACASRDQLKNVKLVGDKKAELIINHFNKNNNNEH
jgi:ERCC4-type nuclease